MRYDSDSSEFEGMSTRKLAILFGLAFFGAFMVIQMIQGFPLAQLFTRQIVTEEVDVSLKNGDICVVEPSDGEPKDIQKCPYDKGDTLIVTYYKGNPRLESYRPK